jgi:nucleotide-binding universal stress UspA family protein
MIIAASSPSLKAERVSGLGPAGLRFRSILVATDCSPASAVAVNQAARLAKESHARLYVLHSILPELYGIGIGGPVPELELVDLQAARESLHQYAEHIPELWTVKHKELVFLGASHDAIRSACKAHGVDLLVVGSHGRRGLAKLALGSVAEWAIRNLNCPVLVTGPTCDRSNRPTRSIVLAVDLAEGEMMPAQYAGSMAQDYNARLTALSVLPEASTLEERAKAERTIKFGLHQLMPSDYRERCTLQFEVRTGDIAAEILQSARENGASLIVLGARTNAPLGHHTPRTKLAAIVRGARCPVLVVPSHLS